MYFMRLQQPCGLSSVLMDSYITLRGNCQALFPEISSIRMHAYDLDWKEREKIQKLEVRIKKLLLWDTVVCNTIFMRFCGVQEKISSLNTRISPKPPILGSPPPLMFPTFFLKKVYHKVFNETACLLFVCSNFSSWNQFLWYFLYPVLPMMS